MRQRSMALMTFSWSRLTWPRLASRQAGPCSRKISATSSKGRDTDAGAYAGGAPLRMDRFRSEDLRQAQPIERALDLDDQARGHARVARRGRGLAWPSSQAWTTPRISVPLSSSCVANLCHSVCSVTGFLMPAAVAACCSKRWNSLSEVVDDLDLKAGSRSVASNSSASPLVLAPLSSFPRTRAVAKRLRCPFCIAGPFAPHRGAKHVLLRHAIVLPEV